MKRVGLRELKSGEYFDAERSKAARDELAVSPLLYPRNFTPALKAGVQNLNQRLLVFGIRYRIELVEAHRHTVLIADAEGGRGGPLNDQVGTTASHADDVAHPRLTAAGRPDDVQIRDFVQFVLNIGQSDQLGGELQFSRGRVAEPRQVLFDQFVQRRFVAEL